MPSRNKTGDLESQLDLVKRVSQIDDNFVDRSALIRITRFRQNVWYYMMLTSWTVVIVSLFLYAGGHLAFRWPFWGGLFWSLLILALYPGSIPTKKSGPGD